MSSLKKITKAVIPAAGYGTRLLPVTKVVPKELLPIGTKPAIQYIVEEAIASGIKEIILIGSPAKKMILDYFRPDPNLNRFLKSRHKLKELEELRRIESLVKWTLVYQREPRGLGHAIQCAEKAVGDEPFLVMLPDDLVAGKTPAALQLMRACGREKTWGLLVKRVPGGRISSYGVIGGKKLRENCWRIDRTVEKPKPFEAPTDLAILGRYLFTPEIFPLIGRSGRGALGEIQITDAINLLARKQSGVGLICKGHTLDVGNPQGLMEATHWLTKLS